MVKYICILSFLLSCTQRSANKEEFTLPQRPFLANELRLDGYYFVKQPDFVKHTPIYFLFRNGALLSAGAIKTDSIAELLNDERFSKQIHDSKIAWGRFLIEEDSIKLEQREHTGGSIVFLIHKGVIDNDSTFRITKVKRTLDGETWTTNEIYRFKKYSPKPDSVSEFLK